MSFKPGKSFSAPPASRYPAPSTSSAALPPEPPPQPPRDDQAVRLRDAPKPPPSSDPLAGWVDADWDEAWAAAEVLAETLSIPVEDFELYSAKRPALFYPQSYPGREAFLALAAELAAAGAELLAQDSDAALGSDAALDEPRPPEWAPPPKPELLARIATLSGSSEGIELFSGRPFGEASETAARLCASHRREAAARMILALAK